MKIHAGQARSESGTAILVVMALLAVMTMLVLANGEALRHLQQELRFIDQEQQQKYEAGPGH